MNESRERHTAEATKTPDPQSIEGLFLTALGKATGPERQAFLDEACGDDTERRLRIVALLRAYDDAGSFLERPISGLSATQALDLSFLKPAEDPGLLGTLGPYEVYELIGRGGMGMVFRARDPKLNRIVAIKVLAPELAAHGNARQRFLREAQAAAAVSHPHVVTIHAVEEPLAGETVSSGQPGKPGLPYIVMECIVGQTLQQKIDRQGQLQLREIVRIGQQIAEGLTAAHRQGLIHRDIKPANILLENGIERVKITDFGLARAADDATITRTGEVSGTPQYMSPEQAGGEYVDHRSDLFSLGCVMYAMCTGRSPFRATSLAAAIKRVCQDAPRPIEEINPEVPAWLISLVMQLLSKQTEHRVQTAADVAVMLEGQLASLQQPGFSPSTTLVPTGPPSVAANPQPSAPTRTRKRSSLPVAMQWVGGLLIIMPLLFSGISHTLGRSGLTAGTILPAWEATIVIALASVPPGGIILGIGFLLRRANRSKYEEPAGPSETRTGPQSRFVPTPLTVVVHAVGILTTTILVVPGLHGTPGFLRVTAYLGPAVAGASALLAVASRRFRFPGDSRESIAVAGAATGMMILSAYLPLLIAYAWPEAVLAFAIAGPIWFLALAGTVIVAARSLRQRRDGAFITFEAHRSLSRLASVLSTVAALLAAGFGLIITSASAQQTAGLAAPVNASVPDTLRLPPRLVDLAPLGCGISVSLAVLFALASLFLRTTAKAVLTGDEPPESLSESSPGRIGRYLAHTGCLLLSLGSVVSVVPKSVARFDPGAWLIVQPIPFAGLGLGIFALCIGIAFRRINDEHRGRQQPLRLTRTACLVIALAALVSLATQGPGW